MAEVGPLPLEVLVRLVADYEDNVGRDLVGGLVTLPLEGDLGAGLPAWLDVNGEHLLLLLSGPVVPNHAA